MTSKPLHPWDELKREGEPLKPAHVYARERNWPKYFDAMAATPARETLTKALDLFDADFKAGRLCRPATGPHAVDLACGEGRDTFELLRRGWHVLAIDGHPEAFERLLARPDITTEQRAKLETRQELMENTALTPLPASLLVNASFALPFCDRSSFPALWERIIDALPVGGRFSGQFFGDRDSWATLQDRTHHTRGEVMQMLEGFVIESLNEEDRHSTDRVHMPKWWHVFHVVARKR